jgi:hypothetical protein
VAVTGKVAASSAAGVVSGLPGSLASAAAIAASVAIGVSPGADGRGLTESIQIAAPAIQPAASAGEAALAAGLPTKQRPGKFDEPAAMRPDAAEPARPVGTTAGTPHPAPDCQTHGTVVVHASVVHVPASNAGTCAKPVMTCRAAVRCAAGGLTGAQLPATRIPAPPRAMVPAGPAVEITHRPARATMPGRVSSGHPDSGPGVEQCRRRPAQPSPSGPGGATGQARPAIPSQQSARQPSGQRPAPARTVQSPLIAVPSQSSPTRRAAPPAQQAANGTAVPDRADQPPPPGPASLACDAGQDPPAVGKQI